MQTTLFQQKFAIHKDASQKINPDSPRGRLLLKGVDSLSNIDLIGLLLYKSGNHSEKLAAQIFELASYSLNNIAKLSIRDLMRLEGIGEAQASVIVASFALNKRRSLEITSKQKITSSRQAFEILRPLNGDSNYEEFYIILLNKANFVIAYKKVSEGGLTGTVADVRRIFKLALEGHATSMIVSHNHPSGNLSPSEADKSLTRRLSEVGTIMDIPVRDHIIVTSSSYFSFADEGFL